uniref:Polyprotein n=1 Tax=Cannabis sativa TaxID=3483 RepID=A0A803Q711_CANSA
MPLSFWDEAVRTACYVINRLPTQVINNNTPLNKLFHKQPDYSILKVFGCACYPNTRPYNKNKLEFRSEKCTFIGYSLKHKGYKCLANSGRIYISRDVIFDEFTFPFFTQSTNTSLPCVHVSNDTTCVIPLAGQGSHSSASVPATSSHHSTAAASPRNQHHPAAVVTVPHQQQPVAAITPQPLQHSPTTAPSEQQPHHHTAASNAPIQPPAVAATDTPPNTSQSVSTAAQTQDIPTYILATQQPTVINSHPMITRAKVGTYKHKALMVSTTPLTVAAAVKSPQWNAAMNSKIYALKRNKTWVMVPLPPGKQAIGCKWVFREKENTDGSTAQFKARPVIKPTTIRVILTIALSKGWPLKQLDINNAFLNGEFAEEVYMSQPPGFIDKESPELVCKLNKAIYGLKKAPRAWITESHTTFILVYVDDIILTGSSPSVLNSLIKDLHAQFSLKDLGTLDYFLGIQVHQLSIGLHLCQKKYITDLLCKAKMDNANPLPTPMTGGEKLSTFNSDPIADPKQYRSIVGALHYAVITRPEIAYAVNKVSQYMHNPLDSHFKVVKKILRYLKGTLDYGLLLKPCLALNIIGFCDADWASDPDDRRSTSGFFIYLGSNLISWSSKKQKTVSPSSTEAEYRSLENATAEVIWLQSLLAEIGFTKLPIPTIWCDNQSTVLMSANPVLHSRTKHIELDLYFVRERILQQLLHMKHTPAMDQVADILTKALSAPRFKLLRDKLSLASLSMLIQNNMF